MAGQSGGRTGAGRPKGSRNNRALADIEAMAKRFPDWTPLQHMAAVANDETLDVEIRLDAAKAAAPYVHARAKPVEMDPDSLVALEGRLQRARLAAVSEMAAEDPAIAALAERLARAKERREHFILMAADVPRSPDGPVIDAEPAPEPEPASPSDISAEGDGAEEATPPPPPPPAPPPAPILPWPDAPAKAEEDYDPWNFD